MRAPTAGRAGLWRCAARTLALCAGLLPGLSAGVSAAEDGSGSTVLRDLWAAREPAFGFYVRPDPQPADAPEAAPPIYSVQTGADLAVNPLPDFAFLSLEHHYDAAAAEKVVRGLRSGGVNSGMSLLVRIPPIADDGADAAHSRVKEALALGADGVVIPHVMSVEEARQAIAFFDGVDVWSPANPEGTIIAMLIVEDPEVFPDLEVIAGLEGYSSLVCGIGSLTAALDGDRDAAETINLQVLAASEAEGLVDMITVDTESVGMRLEQGFLGLLAYGPRANEAIRIGRALAGR